MPAYTTISCLLSKSHRQGCVGAFYDAFLSADVVFDGVFSWECDPEMTFKSIVQWNQSKLDADFVLGYDEHVRHDYRVLR